MFNQKLHVLTICTINVPGSFVNGRVLKMLRHRSFSVRMRRSATGTCSSREHLLRVIPNSANSPRIGSNCPSTSTISTIKPRFTYVLWTSLMCFIIVSALAFLSQATVPNLIARLIDTRNGILFTFITSTQSITLRSWAITDAGIGTCPLYTSDAADDLPC